MNVNIKVFPAKGGDSILVSIDNQKYNILIDSGYKSTYYDYIMDEMKCLEDNNKHLDIFIITHIDNDHILGGIEFLKNNNLKKNIEIENILFNGYRQILSKKNLERNLDINYKCRMKEISSRRYFNTDDFEEDFEEDLADVGYSEGESFSELLLKGKYNINRNYCKAVFKHKDNNKNVIEISNKVKMIILTPTQDDLKDLLDEWERYLKTEGIEHVVCKESEDAFESFVSNSDDFHEGLNDVSNTIFDIENLANKNITIEKTITNKSSISFILIVEKKKYLFLGDAYSDEVLKSLEDLLKYNLIEDLDFEVLKVPHHGSKNNISSALLKKVTCKNYIISTNGVHGHPNKETIAKIIKWNNKCKIYFNYKLDIIDEIKRCRSNKYNFEIVSKEDYDSDILELNF